MDGALSHSPRLTNCLTDRIAPPVVPPAATQGVFGIDSAELRLTMDRQSAL
jgi:hypothetical protein